MKRILIASLIFLLSLTELSAQSNKRVNGKDFGRFQVEVIIKQLSIDTAAQDTFRDVYTQYSAALRQLRPKHHKSNVEQSDAEVEAQIMDLFDRSEQMTALKREYYFKFKKILTPKQILDMYNIERRLNERMSSELQRRNVTTGKQEARSNEGSKFSVRTE